MLLLTAKHDHFSEPSRAIGLYILTISFELSELLPPDMWANMPVNFHEICRWSPGNFLLNWLISNGMTPRYVTSQFTLTL